MLARLFASHRLPVTWRLFAVAAVAALAGTMVFAASKAKIESAWLAAPVTLDGINKEWDALSTIAKDVRFSIAARNDDRRLYIALVTSDRATALQAVNEGLIVWVDPSAGSKREDVRPPDTRSAARSAGRAGPATCRAAAAEAHRRRERPETRAGKRAGAATTARTRTACGR